jgi:ATP-dependent helicase/nuclease subunit B
MDGATHVYTVAPGEPFLERLAAAILNGDLPAAGGRKPHALELPDITVLLPTRRATRALQEAFLRVSGAPALLLPQIRPIAEGDEELSLITGIVNRETISGPDDAMPLPISELQRRLALTGLVMAWSKVMRSGEGAIEHIARGASSPAQAQQLAAELCRLMDMLETENVAIERLAGLVPDAYSAHWQHTLKFLEIITAAWPAHLRETGRISATDRRNRLILAEAARLTAHPPKAPVIVAGVTGSIPATGVLMHAVARLPQGAIVLPGLDIGIDAETEAALPEAPEHPQHGLARLLKAIGVSRASVRDLPGSRASVRQQTRLGFLREAMRPASATEHWHGYAQEADKAALRKSLEGVSLIEAPSATDEAEVVSLILRRAAETPGQTAALVSPDRLLARRVAVRLGTWGIRVDDSAGRPFGKTIPGAFLDLTIEAATSGFTPAALMSLLKHPLARLGLSVGEARRAARALEIAAFRTAYLGRGLEGVEAALEKSIRDSTPDDTGRRRSFSRGLGEQRTRMARDLVARLKAAFEPLTALMETDEPHPLRVLADVHVKTAEQLARLADEEETGAGNPLWDQEAGLAATSFFASLLDANLRAPDVPFSDYADLYRSLVAKETVRPRVPVHPRLFIWGPYEARLQQPDVVILGSLNDGTWPEAADPGPWLNRPMRKELGLPAPEEEIGRAAHDFLSLMGGSRIYLTRAKKVDGVPTVPSRWLMRIDALLTGLGMKDALKPTEPWLGWARWRDVAERTEPMTPPAPCPPIDLRPRKISVSRAETWMANPYALFAGSILNLAAMPPLGQQPDAALRGTIVHEALDRFAIAHASALPADPQAAFLRIIAEVIGEYTGHPRVAAFWLPRLERFAEWFAATEVTRREGVEIVLAETKGQIVFDAPYKPFTLTARADRIDLGRDGVTITDYKTGGLGNLASRAGQGFAPQLLLEAAIAASGGFPGVPGRNVARLRYVSASGGEPAGDEKLVKPKQGDVAGLAAQALDGLKQLVALYDNESTPYRAVRRPGFDYDYDEYAHLARVKEWSVESEGGEGAAS